MIRRVLAVSALVLAGTFGTSAPALAAASVTVSGPDGAAAVPTAGGTVTVTGRGFTSVKAGFGGIYVAFGWVDDAAGGSWRPSRGGITGQDYRYIPDSESRDNAGRLRYVAFPGSSTAAEANGGSLTEDGRFRVQLSIPGPRFSATDRNGRTVEVDCTTVQCGVLTFGAHGVANADNETFTPVRFTAGATRTSDTEREPNARTGSGGPASNGATSGGVATDGQESDPSAPTTNAPPVDGAITVTIDAESAIAGRVLTFTALGLRPGEQVLVRLDDGVAAAGPFTAGTGGDLAGMIELPATLAPGTHQLHLTAAASTRRTSANFAVRAGDAAGDPIGDDAAHTASRGGDAGEIAGWVFLGASAAVLAGVLLWRLLALRRARRPRTPRPGGAPA